MALPTFPFSPMPGGTERFKNWNENIDFYDSGEQQGSSPYVRPLYQWNIPIKLMTDTRQRSLWAFWDQVKGQTRPFLVMDPYDYQVNSTLGVRSGITSGSTLFLCDTNSYTVRADTTTIGSMFSSLSGYVTLGTEYAYDRDSGVLTVNTKAEADVWGVRSMEYFKKARFTGPYREQSPLWNIFATQLQIKELP